MSIESARFQRAIEQLDAAHGEDPRREEVEGVSQPYELLYAQRMSAWLERVAPQASETLRLAVRAQHLRRWALPRDQYPMTRPGYHAWRTELKIRQAEQASTILREAGYDEAECERVAQLIRKENLRRDSDAQALEDTACLVFLQYYFSAFALGHDEEKICGIVRKTWKKMSPHAHELAAELTLSPEEQALVQKALA
ncbi:DUF4202 domain-containing protein [Phytohalomonas tamaricis]|uniref:DUF4202 domain-containing protein n=1 Tax=Phytohalomonas tamaricis TaxID=2081032 RepID=UPI000D0B4291|nr:DUF4202 domain-containing protein [Phytohalomonas tamaricis]